MKKAMLLIAIILMSVQQSYAETLTGNIHLVKKSYGDLNLMGSIRLNEVNAGSLSASGSFQFNMLMVKGPANINGYVTGVNGKFGTLTIHGGLVGKNFETKALTVIGPTDLEKVVIHDKTDIQGPLKAKNTTFQDLRVQASHITLKNVEVNNIIVRQNQTKQQILRLTGKTIVHGTIHFDSGTGHVRQGWKSKIEGAVTGATVGKSKKTSKRKK